MLSSTRHWRFLAFSALFVFLATVPAFSVTITVGQNVQVSKRHSALFHGEVLVAADPVDAKHLIACSGVWPAESDRHPVVMAYMSLDGGLTWNQTAESFSKTDGLDPACAIGFHGVAYLGSYGWGGKYWWETSDKPISRGPDPAHDYFAYSRDGGRTWSKARAFQAGDRDFITIDLTRSRYRGRVYDYALTNDHGSPIHSYIGEVLSTDNGKTFSPRVRVFSNPPGMPTKSSLFSGPMTILSNGTVVMALYQWPNFQNATVVAVASTDGGESFSKPHLITKRTIDFRLPITAGFSPIPLIASDASNGPFHNRIYVAWEDFRFGQGNILVAHSDNAGKTWSEPVIVDDAPPAVSGGGPFASNGAIAVNNRGVVGLIWYDERGIAGNTGAVVRFAASYDGGESFSPSVQLSAPSLVNLDMDRQPLGEALGLSGTATIGVFPRYHVFGGDTSGLVADAGGVFHPVWIDDRTGVSQVWTAAVTVNAAAIRHGDASLESLKDVTNAVVLRFTNMAYDRVAHTASANVAVVNTSTKPIRAPIHVRVVRLSPVRGSTTIAGADNGEPASGAIWVFSPEGTNKILHRGDRTAYRTLTFHIDQLQPYAIDTSQKNVVPYVSFQFKAYSEGI